MNDQTRSWRALRGDTSELGRDLANFVNSRFPAGGVEKANKVSFPRNNWAETGAEMQQRRPDTSAERAARILSLQREIAAGQYRVSAADIVERMMTVMRRDV